jgi:hypothetical protein
MRWLTWTSTHAHALASWRCHSSRRWILPEFSLEAIERELESDPLFAIDLAAEANQFKVALKGAKIHANTVNAMMRRLDALAGLMYATRLD